MNGYCHKVIVEKAYYTFVPFKEGNYRVLVLAKSFHKNIPYEDYDLIEFEVK